MKDVHILKNPLSIVYEPYFLGQNLSLVCDMCPEEQETGTVVIVARYEQTRMVLCRDFFVTPHGNVVSVNDEERQAHYRAMRFLQRAYRDVSLDPSLEFKSLPLLFPTRGRANEFINFLTLFSFQKVLEPISKISMKTFQKTYGIAA